MIRQLEFNHSDRVRRIDAYEHIAKRLEETIIKNSMKPGESLPPERELARHFGVSRPTMAVALQLLEHRGLVERKVGIGTLIKEVPNSIISDAIRRYTRRRQSSLVDLMLIRMSLEPTAAECAALNASDEEIEQLRELTDRIMNAFYKKNKTAYIEMDLKFHEAIAAATHNELMIAIMLALQDSIKAWMKKGVLGVWPKAAKGKVSTFQPEGVKSHVVIFEAISARDTNRARQAMDGHMQISRKMFETLGLWK